MTYVKSLAVGCITGITACVLWILAVVVVPVMVPLAAAWFGGAGVGGGGAVVSSFSLMVVTALGFAAGFAWQFRRTASVNGKRVR
jgi:hypothetical protein